MGFLDNLKDKAEEFGEKAREGFEAARDKASDLVGDVQERLDPDETSEPTSQEKVEAAADYSPEAVEEASRGIDAAVAESTAAAEASAPSTVDPLESSVGTAGSAEPVAGLGAVADEPVTAPDPLDGTPDLTVADEPVEPVVAPDDPLDGTPERDIR